MTVSLGMPAGPPPVLAERRHTRKITLRHPHHPVEVGGDAPISVQSLTTTVPADVNATLQQIAELTTAGCQVVRVAVPSQDDAEALPLIHTGALAKKVYFRGAAPLFAPIPKTSDWVPAEATYSINSTDTYDGPVGSASSSLGQASFNAILTDGITDAFLAQSGKDIWVEFRPDRDKLVPKQLTQGILGIGRTFPAGGGSFTAACTVTPREKTLDVKA